MRLTRQAAFGAAFTVGALVTPSRAAPAQSEQGIPPERLAARRWFQDAKFGLFIHWGAYSLLGQGEWVMQNRKITVPEYEWRRAAWPSGVCAPLARGDRCWVGV